MSTQSHAAEKISVALESIQSKRRIERVMEAANALLDRYAKQPDHAERLRLTFELIRRNFTGEITIDYGDLTLGSGNTAAPDGRTTFHCTFTAPGGKTGTLTAHYTAPGSMGLTDSEWLDAMRLLAGISALGVGGTVTCPE
ncbi:hypothetical protein ACFY12_19775 [Streptomyces sp. NPDC001339]|uniref:hypothetical protein n=1 Tax=Streptomyces sp. NPDC001339 TaxID=3364563 RepID=UPI0036B007AD